MGFVLLQLELVLLFVLLCSQSSLGCSITDCETHCMRDIAREQWGTAADRARIAPLITSLSLYIIDSGYWEQGLIGPHAYAQETSFAYVCENDPLLSIYSAPGINGNDIGNNIFQNPTLQPPENTGTDFIKCTTDTFRVMPLNLFKDTRTVNDNHGSGSLEQIFGRSRTWNNNNWAQGFDGYLPALGVPIEVKPTIYFYNDVVTLKYTYLQSYLAKINERILYDLAKNTIIVSTGITIHNYYDIPDDEFYRQYCEVGNEIFKNGGLVISPLENFIDMPIGAPTCALNVIGAGAVDYNTKYTWEDSDAIGQSQHPTAYGSFLKPAIQGYNKFCAIDNGIVTGGTGCSYSTPTVTAAALAMHAILKSYQEFLTNTIKSVANFQDFNGVIAAWLINSGTFSPYTRPPPVPQGMEEEYEPDLNGAGLWNNPFKQFYPEDGKYMFFSSSYLTRSLLFIPLFTIPKSFLKGQTMNIPIKVTVYFRIMDTVFLPFQPPAVELKYYTREGDEFKDYFLQSLSPNLNTPLRQNQGNKPDVTISVTATIRTPGTFYLRTSCANTDRVYVASYLDIASEVGVDLFFPGVKWNNDNQCNDILKETKTAYSATRFNSMHAWLAGYNQ